MSPSSNKSVFCH